MDLFHSNPKQTADDHPVNRWFNIRLELNWETWVYIAILLVAIFTRFYILGDRTMSHDESLHTKFSWDLYRNGVFVHTPLMHGPILFHMTALNYFLFGDNDFTARIYPAVLGVLMVMFPVLFRRWLGRWGAILASLLFLISPLILYYNRYIREDTPSIFYTLIMVYCTFMYLNGPVHLRRKARWLYIFSGAMLASLATKETAFMYIAIFGSVLTLYWLVRLGQHFLRLPGRTVLYFLSVGILMAGALSLVMYVILSITPTDNPATLSPGTLENTTFIRWMAASILGTIFILVGTAVWAFRRSRVRIPWMDAILIIALIAFFTAFFVAVEERSHVTTQSASQAAAPAVPGQETAAAAATGYIVWPFYAFWIVCILLIAALIYSWRAGWWRQLHRFAELDILIVMGSLVLPWLTPFVMKAMNPSSLMSMPEIARAVQAALPVQFDLSQYAIQIFLSSLPVIPALLLSTIAGLIWGGKRWLISAGIFYGLFLFFFTTVFTNIQGIGTGMIGSLGYWLEQQAVRRGNQPQYYYLVLVLPFYEFLPIIGSVLTMFTGLTAFWRFRRRRLEEQQAAADRFSGSEPAASEMDVLVQRTDVPDDKEAAVFSLLVKPYKHPERLTAVPFLIFVSWWAVFNMIAYTLAGEKMPWLGTHMTTPMIFLAAWYFGRFFDRIEARSFWSRGWLYAILLPILLVAVVQLISPFVVGQGVGGLEQQQLSRTFQWLSGLVIGGIVIYAVIRLALHTGWVQLRAMIGVVAFGFLAFLTFRSAWMASFINYDLATEYLVYAHGGPANKRVTEQLAEWSERITGAMDLQFAYDFKISWPGAWYFRDFRNARFLGENPSPRDFDNQLVVIVGDENRAAVETILEDRYYRFDYPRMWWPMQDYFNLTAQRVLNTFDFSPENVQAAQIRQGIWDIWWSRDYTRYGSALQRDFSLARWPVSDRMYVFVRKDIAAQIWDLGVGDGTVASSSTAAQTNLCTANWQPLEAVQVIQSVSSGLQPMNHPRQIAMGSDGRLYVAEEFNHRVSVFNADGTFAFAFGSQGTEPGQFERPNGIAIGPSGNIYVADTWNYRVQVFTPDGRFLNAWGQRGEYGASAPAQPVDAFWGPRAVAVDSAERVYVADTGNKRIRVYTSQGQFIQDIGSAGSGTGQLDEPSGLVISPDGLLYVADTWNRRVSVFTLDGNPVTIYQTSSGEPTNSFRVRGWVDDLGNRPYLALDPVRRLIYITDPDAGRVLVYSTDGNCAGAFGQLGREALGLGQFTSIGGVTLDAAGNVYVADAGASRILKFAAFTALVPEGAAQPVQQGSLIETTPDVISAVSEMTLEITPEVTPEPGG